MIQNLLWAISFFTLWITIVWIAYISFKDAPIKLKYHPTITIAIPAYNEEKTLEKTIKSINQSNYPKDKLKLIIVNDGSKDNTKQVALKLIQRYKQLSIQLINKKNAGKASAVNSALNKAKTELFAVLDADSRISKTSISILVAHFDNPNNGAAISRIKIDTPKKMIEKVQRFEYIMSSLLRKIMSIIGTLSMTPGVLSIYSIKALKKVGGFTKEKENLTEDLEIAMRLKYNGYNIIMDHNSITYTLAPNTLKKLWDQRIRWSRGYIFNHLKYKDMFFSKKYGLFGIFQLPVNALAIILLVINIAIISVMFFSNTYELIIRSLTIKGYFINWITDLPTFKDLLLAQSFHIIIPLIISALLGFYMIYKAHKQFREKLIRHAFPIITYFLLIPYFITINWITSIIKEILKFKRSW